MNTANVLLIQKIIRQIDAPAIDRVDEQLSLVLKSMCLGAVDLPTTVNFADRFLKQLTTELQVRSQKEFTPERLDKLRKIASLQGWSELENFLVMIKLTSHRRIVEQLIKLNNVLTQRIIGRGL